MYDSENEHTHYPPLRSPHEDNEHNNNDEGDPLGLVHGWTEVDEETGRLWCVPPKETVVPLSPQDAVKASGVPAEERCIVCGSEWCVLKPCPQCSRFFCASHRFHGHEDAADAQQRVHRGAAHALLRANGSAVCEGWNALHCICAPYTTARPLSLAPPGYTSRLQENTLLLARPVQKKADDSEAVHSQLQQRGVPPTSSPHPATTPRLADWEVGVCSVRAAVEASIGQLLQRTVSTLQLVPGNSGNNASTQRAATALAMDDPAVQEVVASSWVLRCTACSRATGASHTGVAASSGAGRCAIVPRTREAPTVWLEPLDLLLATKEAVPQGEVIVLALNTRPASTKAGDVLLSPALASLAAVISMLLYGRQPFEGLEKDRRVRALATRLLLSSTVPSAKAAQAYQTDTADAPDNGVTPSFGTPTEPPAASTRTEAPVEIATPTTASTSEESAPWPLRTPPPLQSFSFANTRAAPLGAAQAKAGPNRVTVAVFVEDGALPCVVPPFVLALARDWPSGKVLDRVGDEVRTLIRKASSPPPTSPSFTGFELFLCTSSSSPSEGEARCLTAGKYAAAAAKPAAELKDGDVLFFGRPAVGSASEPSVTVRCHPAVEAELRRLKHLSGKAQAALRVDMMKKCAVM